LQPAVGVLGIQMIGVAIVTAELSIVLEEVDGANRFG